MAKAAPWTDTDAEVRKRGEQTGLDTPVVKVSSINGSSTVELLAFTTDLKTRLRTL